MFQINRRQKQEKIFLVFFLLLVFGILSLSGMIFFQPYTDNSRTEVIIEQIEIDTVYNNYQNEWTDSISIFYTNAGIYETNRINFRKGKASIKIQTGYLLPFERILICQNGTCAKVR